MKEGINMGYEQTITIWGPELSFLWGFIIGLLPLMFGAAKRNFSLAVIGFVVSLFSYLGIYDIVGFTKYHTAFIAALMGSTLISAAFVYKIAEIAYSQENSYTTTQLGFQIRDQLKNYALHDTNASTSFEPTAHLEKISSQAHPRNPDEMVMEWLDINPQSKTFTFKTLGAILQERDGQWVFVGQTPRRLPIPETQSRFKLRLASGAEYVVTLPPNSDV